MTSGTIHRNALAAKFRSFLGAESVLDDAEELKPYECDGLTAYRQTPLLVVLPETIEQVQRVLRVCSDHQVPVVARGAGTGLSGGALPLADGVLLVLAKFNSILSVDTANRTARVQPGVRNLAISEAVDAYGLYYAPDPSSQIACSIGGNVAENAGGLHCLKYGLTVHNILALEVLTMDGERLTIGAQSLDAAGYDLLALLTGSEGLLAIIVEITVRLLPKPECARVLLAAFDDVGAAGTAVGRIIAEGIIPAGLEMMDNAAVRAAEDFVHAGYPTDAAAILLCELDGIDSEVADRVAQVAALLEDCHATEVRVARDDEERALFWAGRKAAFPAVGPPVPGLLLHGWHHPAPGAAQGSDAYRRALGGIWIAGGQCLSRRVTATSIPSFFTMPTGTARWRESKSWARRFWSCAWRSAAPSPGSTAWESRKSIRCAHSSRPPSSITFTRSNPRSTCTGFSTPARPCPR